MIGPKSLFFAVALLCAVLGASAQEDSLAYVLQFEDINLHQVLKSLHKEYDIDYAYDVKSLRSERITVTVLAQDEEELTQQILAGTQFSYRNIGGTFVVFIKNTDDLQRPPPTKYNVSVSGKVTDKATGTALPFTNILVLENNKLFATNDSGFFKIDSITTDTNTLLFSHVGYNSFLLGLRPEKALEEINVELIESFGVIKSAEIKANRTGVFSVSDQPSVQSIDVESALRIPNTGQPDLYNAARLIPGVRSLGSNGAELHIRGGSTSENLVRLDGYTIFNPQHFNGVYSVFHPKSIAQLDIYKSTYSASLGGRSSGIIDAKTLTGHVEKVDVNLGVNPLGADVMVEIPVLPNRLGVMIAFRRTFTDFWQNGIYKRQYNGLYNNNIPGGDGGVDAFEVGKDPFFFFYDLTTHIDWRINSQDRLWFSQYQGEDFFRMGFQSIDTVGVFESDEVSWVNRGYGLNYERIWNPRITSKISLNASRLDNQMLSAESILENEIASTTQKSEISEQALRVDIEGSKDKHQWGVGAGWVGFNTEQSLKDPVDLLLDRTPDSREIYLYGEDVLKFNKRWLASLGARLTQYRNTLIETESQVYFEPRAHLLWSPTDSWRAKFALGRHVQSIRRVQTSNIYLDQLLVWLPADGESVPLISSQQAVAGVTFEKKKFTADIEGYYKFDQGITDEWAGVLDAYKGDVDNLNFGDRWVIGLDAQAQTGGKHHGAMLGYSLSKIDQAFEPTIGNVAGSNDRLHVLKMVYFYKVKQGQFSATFVWGTGTRFTPQVQNGEVNVWGILYSEKLQPINRLNIGFVYDITVRDRWSMQINASISNLFDNKNALFRHYGEQGNPVNGTDVGILPSLTLNVKF